MTRVLAIVCALVSFPGIASAADVPCAPAEKSTISLDGLADDWNEVTGTTAGDDGSRLSLRCNTEGPTLYLAITADDDRIVRTKQGRPGEDQVTLVLGGKHYTLFPASESQKALLKPGGARIASTSNAKGFVIEVALPLASVGLGKHPDRIPYTLRFDDCDSAAALKTERSVSLDGQLAFTEGASSFDSFLSDRGLSRSIVRWQHAARAGKQAVQLVLAGKYLASVSSDGYGFVELPVSDGKDVEAPTLVDLAGDGRAAVLVRYTERGGNGSREVLAAFRPEGAGLKRVFAVELGKRTDTGKLSSRLTLKRRGKATDLVVEALPAEGLTADSYKEAPADDMEPIVLPWAAPKKAGFRFLGDRYERY